MKFMYYLSQNLNVQEMTHLFCLTKNLLKQATDDMISIASCDFKAGYTNKNKVSRESSRDCQGCSHPMFLPPKKENNISFFY